MKENMKGFTVPAILTGITHKVDKSLSVRFTTGELSPEEKLKIAEHHMTQGWLLFAEDTIQETDIPETKSEARPKSQSERIRAVLYRVWELDKVGSFDKFYLKRTEKIIDHFKSQLNSN